MPSNETIAASMSGLRSIDVVQGPPDLPLLAACRFRRGNVNLEWDGR